MPRRGSAPSPRTSTLVVRSCWNMRATATMSVSPETTCAGRRNASSTFAVASDCISRWLWRSASAESFIDRSEKSSAPKVALPAMSELTAWRASW